jgi:hypothetical protein
MYLSKIQVKNFFVKNLGKYAVSRTMRGRVCFYSSSGYKFDELADGFVGVRYSVSDRSYKEREKISKARLEEATSLLLANGFETNGQGFRKLR